MVHLIPNYGTDVIIIACDRVALNSDTEAKIATCSLNIIVKYHNISMNIAFSTSDNIRCENGKQIEIKEKSYKKTAKLII